MSRPARRAAALCAPPGLRSLAGVAFLCTGLAAFAQGLPTTTPEDVGLSTERLEKLGMLMREEVRAGRLPGAVVMVARRGRLAYAQAFGRRDPQGGSPMTTDSVFRIYSMTKPLVSVAAMLLVEDGKLQLTDPVSKFLPAFEAPQVSVANADAEFARITYTRATAIRPMTIHDLLRHTAGLAYGEITQNAPVKEALEEAGVF